MTEKRHRLFVVALFALLTGCSRDAASREASHIAAARRALEKNDLRRAVIEYKVASQNMPSDPEPLYQLGMIYLTAGTQAAAIDVFRKALRLAPKHEGTRFQMAVLSVGSNTPAYVEEGKQYLAAYARRHPERAEALGWIALADAKLGNANDVSAMLEAALTRDPSSLRPAVNVIAFYEKKGEKDAAAAVAREIAARLPNSSEAAVLRARVAIDTGDFAVADEQIGRALMLKPDSRPALELALLRRMQKKDMPGVEQTTRSLSGVTERSAWAAHARFLFAQHKVDEGSAEFEKLLATHGNDSYLRNDYSARLRLAGRSAQAEAVVSESLRRNPRDPEALLQRVALRIDRGDLAGASADVQTLYDRKAVSAQLLYEESRISEARGDRLEQGNRLAASLKADPRYLRVRLELARVVSSIGETSNALRILAEASPADRNKAEFLYQQNELLMVAGDWGEARAGVDRGLTLARSADFLFQDAALRMHAKDVTGARGVLEEALRTNPLDLRLLNLLGDAMWQQGQSDQYLARLRQVVAANPRVIPLRGLLAARLQGAGKIAEARLAYEESKAVGDPIDADCQIALMDLRRGALDQARDRLTNLIRTHDNARARILLADIEMKKGAPADVIVDHYAQALKLEPKNVLAMSNMADILASRQGEYDKAVSWAQKAAALAPGNPIVADTLGWSLYLRGQYSAALLYLDQSLRTLDRPLAHYHLAAALAKSGDRERGRAEYQTAIRLDPQSPLRRSMSSLFEQK